MTGIAYITARRQYAAGTLPVPMYRLGRLMMVGEPLTGAATGAGQVGQVVVYARVWSVDQKPVGSTLDGHRKKLLVLLGDPAVSTIVVEHRDRLARFGAEYVQAALTAQCRRLPLRAWRRGQPCQPCGRGRAHHSRWGSGVNGDRA